MELKIKRDIDKYCGEFHKTIKSDRHRLNEEMRRTIKVETIKGVYRKLHRTYSFRDRVAKLVYKKLALSHKVRKA